MLLKIKLRALLNNRKISAIGLASLTIGILSVILLKQYIGYELSYDKFYTNYDALYRVTYQRSENSSLIESACTPSRLPYIIKDEIPEIKSSTRVIKEIPLAYTDIEHKYTDQTLLWVDAGFIDVFSLRLKFGGAEKALERPHTTVISSSMAFMYFGDENPIGKTIYVNEGFPLEVTAVCEDFPKNSHLNFDFLTNISTAQEYNWASIQGSWRLSSNYTYIRLSNGNSAALINDKLKKMVEKYIQSDGTQETNLILQPVADIHLKSHLTREFNSNSDIKTIYLLQFIFAGILLLTWINYFNLITTSSFEKDYKEWFIRKVQGANKRDILFQNIASNLLLHFIAIALAVVLFYPLLPIFARITGEPLQLGILHFEISKLLFLILIAGSGISALFQTYYVSGLKNSGGVKAVFSQNKTMFAFQKILGISQFAASITFIILIVGFLKQVNFMQTRDLGMDLSQTLVLPAPYSLNNDTTKDAKFEYLKTELITRGIISDMSASLFIPGKDIRTRELDLSYGQQQLTAEVIVNNIDHAYLDVYRHSLLAGRNFRRNESGNHNIIINESMAKLLGFSNTEDAIDQSIRVNNYRDERIIVGVVKNSNYRGLSNAISPLILQYDAHPEDFGYYSANIFTRDLQHSMKTIQRIWNELYPVDPVNSYFADDNFNNQYNDLNRSIQIFSLFTVLAILISCIGLIGVSILNSIKRTKEIGVRKVNGAKIPEVLFLLNKDFVKWVVIAFVIAAPVAWFVMQKWLENFAYRTNLSWWIFFLAGILSLTIALLTVSFQSWKAATKNPVDALRYE